MLFNMESPIELAKQYSSCLWNTKSADYRDQTQNDNTLKEISRPETAVNSGIEKRNRSIA